MPNGWRYAVAYYGIQLAGAVAVLVNTRFAAAGDRVCAGRLGRVLRGDRRRAGPAGAAACPHWDVDELTAPGPGRSRRVARPGAGGTDVANILYTSGTTGRPKGAMQTHGNLVFNAGTVASVFGVTAADRTLVVAPMFHATGIASQLVGFGAHGAACVFQPRFRGTQMREALIEPPDHVLRRGDRDDPADAGRPGLRPGGPARAADGLLRRRAGGRGVPGRRRPARCPASRSRTCGG